MRSTHSLACLLAYLLAYSPDGDLNFRGSVSSHIALTLPALPCSSCSCSSLLLLLLLLRLARGARQHSSWRAFRGSRTGTRSPAATGAFLLPPPVPLLPVPLLPVGPPCRRTSTFAVAAARTGRRRTRRGARAYRSTFASCPARSSAASASRVAAPREGNWTCTASGPATTAARGG